jgi:hypothetical protein
MEFAGLVRTKEGKIRGNRGGIKTAKRRFYDKILMRSERMKIKGREN